MIAVCFHQLNGLTSRVKKEEVNHLMLAAWFMRMNEETREKKKRKEEKKEKEEAAEEAGAGLSLNNIIMLVIRMLLQV